LNRLALAITHTIDDLLRSDSVTVYRPNAVVTIRRSVRMPSDAAELVGAGYRGAQFAELGNVDGGKRP
jgi:hypothetical protein